MHAVNWNAEAAGGFNGIAQVSRPRPSRLSVSTG